MSEPERIWPDALYCLHPDVKTFAEMVCSPERKEYIRADLVEAAVKRALEGAAQEAAQTYLKSPDLYELGVAAADNIRALDPAQFIDGEK